MSQAAPAIEADGLIKRYGDRTVVDRLDLRVEQGEILAMLGPNGAGKTTTVEIIEGYRAPDGGEVRVLGRDPRAGGTELRARLGIMLQRGDLWNQARVLEALRLFAAFFADPLDPDEVLARVGLADRARARYRTLSGGERQRLALALALVGRPEVAILDEPTAAMDVAARRLTWELLGELRSAGATILLTTHLLDEAAALADRIAILAHGRLVALGSPADLGRAETAAGAPLVVEFEGPPAPEVVVELTRLPAARGVSQSGPEAWAIETDDPAALLVELAGWMRERGLVPRQIGRGGGSSLEELFVRLTGDAAGER